MKIADIALLIQAMYCQDIVCNAALAQFIEGTTFIVVCFLCYVYESI